MDQLFTAFANAVSYGAGHTGTFTSCCGLVLLWAATGPLFDFSDSWQLVINTTTTIVTFLMVFLIQNTQNRDGAAIQAKLDALIEASSASNAFVGIEHLPQAEVERFREQCEQAAQVALASADARARKAMQEAT